MTIPQLASVSVCYETAGDVNLHSVSCNFNSGVSAGGRYLLCGVTYEPAPISRSIMGVTYAGQTCSYIAHIEGILASPDQRGAVFGLKNPPVGNNAFVVSIRSATDNAALQVNGVVYTGVDQNDPVGSVSTSYAYLLNASTVGQQRFTPKSMASRVVAYMSTEGGNLPLDATAGWTSVLQREMVSGYGTGVMIGHYGTSTLSEQTLTFSNAAEQPYANLPYTMIMIELRQSGTPALVSRRRRGLERF